MANVREPNEGEEQEWIEWAKDRPEVIQKLAERFKPWKLYRLKSSNHRVLLYSFYEDGTLCVIVSGQYNLVGFERRVFGIKPDDLEECDLPGPDELVGVTMDDEQTLQHINLHRKANGLKPLTAAELDEITVDGECAVE